MTKENDRLRHLHQWLEACLAQSRGGDDTLGLNSVDTITNELTDRAYNSVPVLVFLGNAPHAWEENRSAARQVAIAAAARLQARCTPALKIIIGFMDCFRI